MLEPADHSSFAARPPRWGRNRRRWFYLIVTAATVALLWGGWSWWYRADFPMPPIPSSVAGIKLQVLDLWVYEKCDDLVYWKRRRETAQVRLAGTIWRDFDTGVQIRFGSNGRLTMIPPPKKELGSLEQLFSSVNGATYRARADAEWDSHRSIMGWPFFPAKPNLLIPDSNWDGIFYFNGKNLSLHFSHRESGSISFSLWLGRIETNDR